MKISELKVNDMCEITLVVKSATARETKSNKPYLTLELFDGEDIIMCNYWDWSSGNIPAVNTILDVTARVTEWQGVKQLNIKAMKNNTTRHLADFMPSSGHDLSDIYKDAYTLLSGVNDDTLRSLSLGLLTELNHKWLTIPGAKGVHHAYTGGTLVHSLSVARIAKAIAENIPEANIDLCIVGGMLHDIGKLYTYYTNGISIDVTDDGKLYDHIFMGAEFIGNYAEEYLDCGDDFVNRKVQLLRHIILSHHGKLEYGSPVTPKCIEALIVNHADDIDASVEQIRCAAKKVPENLKWTDKIYFLNNSHQLTPSYVDYVMNSNSEEMVN